MKRLEVEDSKVAEALAEEYRKQGIDVRGMSPSGQADEIVPKLPTSTRLPTLMDRASFGRSWRDVVEKTGESSEVKTVIASRKGKEKAVEPIEDGQSLWHDVW
jgi:hypothetical protein